MRYAVAILAAAVSLMTACGRTSPSFQIEELTIQQVHAAFAEGRVTCRGLVDRYLRRIAAHDKQGARLNAIVLVNSQALQVADELDRRYGQSGLAGPLHCVPAIVKDNFETRDMPTTAGSLSLINMNTGKDASVVRRLREAGAVVIAKSNMAEFAFSPVETVSSILPGYTRNPYDTTRVTAGSSGGSAAALAANFALIALASDTGNSIRGPAAHQALVGLRSTMGLVSRAGIVPLNLAADVAGFLTRTVADTASVLQVIAGEDQDDPVTAASGPSRPVQYASSLASDGLRGARIGVLHQAYDTPTLDSEVKIVFERALGELHQLGAEIIDPAAIPDLDELRRGQPAPCNQFKHDLNNYLSSLRGKAPLSTLEQIIKSRQFHPSVQVRLETAQSSIDVPGVTAGCKNRDEFRRKLRTAVLNLMTEHRLNALIYPTWSNPPRLIGDLNTPAGDNNQLFAPATGFPAITVPMGFTRGNTLPAGLQFFGRPWDESTLIRLAYAYEQGTRHRRPPKLE